jgi:methionine biosynthesis protein MetW
VETEYCMNTKYEFNDIRLDHRIILDLVPGRATVLDLGCGTGDLLSFLVRMKGITGRGIELDEKAIYSCVEKGLSVFHGDIDSGIADYADNSFNFVILNQTLQQVKNLEAVLADALRIGKKTIVGFPNFAQVKARAQIFFRGSTPITSSLPYAWYSTPNLHFFSISDFTVYCGQKSIRIEKKHFLLGKKRITAFPNLFADMAIFLLSKS